MHCVFESISGFSTDPEVANRFLNFVECADVNPSGIGRFTVSPIISTLIQYRSAFGGPYRKFLEDVTYSTKIPDTGNYLIAAGVAHSPQDWCGDDGTDKKSVFFHLKPQYLRDLQSGRAFLLLDQCHEGYHAPWLWLWFHQNCDRYGINPRQIIYVTGDLASSDTYDTWTARHAISGKMLIVPYTHFEKRLYEASIEKSMVETIMLKTKYPSFDKHLEYKSKNISKIKAFNALQKRARAHRIWLFKGLYDQQLLEHGINSMSSFDPKSSYFEHKFMDESDTDKLQQLVPMLPFDNPTPKDIAEFISQDCGKYLIKLNDEIMLDSWLSVISEASFGDSDGNCFISEKTFKPIACSHPFIIFGNRHSLAKLRDMGYKTFSPYINESYDTLPTWERYHAIIAEIKRITSMTDAERMTWFLSMQSILEHNVETFRKNSTELIPAAMKTIKDYVQKTS